MSLDFLTSARCRYAPHANSRFDWVTTGNSRYAGGSPRTTGHRIAKGPAARKTHRDHASEAAFRWIIPPKAQELWGNLRKSPTNRLTYLSTVAAGVSQASFGWGLPRRIVPIHCAVSVGPQTPSRPK